MRLKILLMFLIGAIAASCGPAVAAQGGAAPDLTRTWVGYVCLTVFAAAYALVMIEETTQLRKSKPMLIAAGLIWLLVGIAYMGSGAQGPAARHIEENLLDYAELLLFLLTAMTYVNVLQERGAFDALKARLERLGLSYRQLFWATGALAFFLSPFLDNLTTALVLGAVVMALGRENTRFVALASINVVIAANAGGAFSPFGDITTLMVWQHGHVGFFQFFDLFVPSLVNVLVPATIMHFAVPGAKASVSKSSAPLKPGAWIVLALFAATIATAVFFNAFLGLPPVFGMMLGLGYLQLFGFYLQRKSVFLGESSLALDVLAQTARADWDTLLFFYGVILSVGGLSQIGYLAELSHFLYGGHGATTANIVIGLASSVLDNIPLMFAVLTMNPAMSHGEWLLIALTAGVGGSLLSIGSAAGVALMGVARGTYTFFTHLKWCWAIALGYAASIAAHLLLNRPLF